MGCTIVIQTKGVSSNLAHRSISKAYWLLYKWLFSDLLYKESFDINKSGIPIVPLFL